MAHLITSTDGALYGSGRKAWHGLGIVHPGNPSPREALKLSGCDFRIIECPLTATHPDGFLDVPTHKALFRSDTKALIAVAGIDYYVLQNERSAELAESLASGSDPVKVETMFTLRGGRDFVFTAHIDSFGVGQGERDVQKLYALFSNAHDGSRKYRALPTAIRIECNNMLQLALRQGASDGVEIAHTASLPDQLIRAREAILGIRKAGQVYKAQADSLVARKFSSDELRDFFAGVYELMTETRLVLNPTKGNKAEERQARRAETLLADWMTRMDQPNQTIGGIGGSAWAALNAVTEWSDHARTVRTGKAETEEDARTFSNLFGSSADVKRRVFARALAKV